MSFWSGSEAKNNLKGLPHSTKIISKPKGVGTELKSLVDCDTGIMLRLDIVEGKERQKLKQYHKEGAATTAQVLRLAEPYFTSERTVVADSYFSSVNTLKSLAVNGMYFMGCVKTAHSHFPRKYLKLWSDHAPPPSRGAHICLESTYLLNGKEMKMYALGWKDLQLKTLVSNRETTAPGTPSVRKRSKVVEKDGKQATERYTIEVQRPKMVEAFYDHFSGVDQHNRYRQGILSIEAKWATKKWWHRVFATVFGMILTDTFLCHQFLQKGKTNMHKHRPVSFLKFLERLCYQLTIEIQHQDRPLRSLSSAKCSKKNQVWRRISINCECFNMTKYLSKLILVAISLVPPLEKPPFAGSVRE